MDGVSHPLHGHGAAHHLCGNLWRKMLFMMWTTSLVLGSVGTLDCCSGDATCGDGWSVPSGEGTWGIQKHVCQSVVQNAAYDLYINFGFGVQGHLGMGLVGLSHWGWMECAIWRRDLGYPKTCVPKCGAKCRLRFVHQLWFWGPRAPRHGACGVVPLGMDGVCHLEKGPGVSKTCVPKCGAKCCLRYVHQLWFWGPRAPRNGDCGGVPLGMDGFGHLEQGPGATKNMCAKVWCKTSLTICTSVLMKGSKAT